MIFFVVGYDLWCGDMDRTLGQGDRGDHTAQPLPLSRGRSRTSAMSMHNGERGERVTALQFLGESLLKRLFCFWCWIKKIKDQSDMIWRGAITINEHGIFLKQGAPLYKAHLFLPSLFRKTQSRWRFAPGRPLQCAWALPSFPSNTTDELFTLTWQITAPRVAASMLESLLSPTGKPLVLRTSALSYMKYISSMSALDICLC